MIAAQSEELRKHFITSEMSVEHHDINCTQNIRCKWCDPQQDYELNTRKTSMS
jgi:hypothetical protein